MYKLTMMLSACLALGAGALSATDSLNIGTVNMQRCIETSLAGQKFDTDIKDLETRLKKTLDEKQAELKAIADKLQDEDYLDSLAPEAEKELQVRGGNLQMELQQMGQQAMQVVQQARQMAMQEIGRMISEASKTVAEKHGYSYVISEEQLLFSNNSNDATEKVVVIMNKNYEKEKAAAEQAAASSDKQQAA